LGRGIYKIRLKSSDIPKGKRSGYRVITYVVDEEQKIRLFFDIHQTKESNNH